MQDRAYEEQLVWKRQLLRSHFSGWPDIDIPPVVPSPSIEFYRNKMEFSFGDGEDRRRLKLAEQPGDNSVHLGLHPKKRFGVVVPTPECQLQSSVSRDVSAVVAAWATERAIPVYIRKDNSGVLRHLVVREGKNTGERMVNLITSSGLHESLAADLGARIRGAGLPVTTFLWTVNDALSDVATGVEKAVFWGDGVIREIIGETTIRVRPGSFLQTNTHAAEKMIRLLAEWLDEDMGPAGGGRRLWDLYCGSGSIGLNLARGRRMPVTGIEVHAGSIEEARANAVFNGILNAEFLAGRVEQILPAAIQPGAARDIVVVDPPRPGLLPAVIDALLGVAPPSVYYVSCNPETLARDLRRFEEKYTIVAIQPMDFFPHTHHVETAVRLRRKS